LFLIYKKLDGLCPLRGLVLLSIMNNNSVYYLAIKYLKGRKARGVSRAHYLSLAGITLGVLALLCVASVMNGFRSDIRKRIVGTFSQIRLSAPEGKTLTEYPATMAKLAAMRFKTAPIIRTELLIKYGQVVLPTLCFGIDLNRQRVVSDNLEKTQSSKPGIMQGIVAGNLEENSFEADGIALGAGLAAQLGVYLNDEVQVLSPVFNVPSAFGMLPRVRFLRVQAIFAAGMPEYDQSYSYIPLSTAEFFALDTTGADYLEIMAPSNQNPEKALRKLKAGFPQYQIEDWSSFDSSLYSAIRFEKFIMFIIMLFMFIIASFNLTGNLLKTLSQKKRELGLLKALGLSDKNLQKLFLIQALALCTIGIVLGLGLGTLLLLVQQHTGLIKLGMGDGAAMVLPVKLLIADYLLIIFVSYLLTVLSVLLPLGRIKHINAVQLIRRTV